METRDFIKAALGRIKIATDRVLDGMTYSEMTWQPRPDANSIGLIIFHQSRSEDRFVQARIKGKPEIWETEEWYKKLKMPVTETGSGYTAEQVAAFVPPRLADLQPYADAVRAHTLDFLAEMTPAKFARIITFRGWEM